VRSCTVRPSQVIKDLEDWCRGMRTRNTKKGKEEYGVTVPALKGFGELWHRHLCDTSASCQEASFSIFPFPERTGADEGRAQGGRSRDCKGWCHTGGSCHCWESKTRLALSLSSCCCTFFPTLLLLHVPSPSPPDSQPRNLSPAPEQRNKRNQFRCTAQATRRQTRQNKEKRRRRTWGRRPGALATRIYENLLNW
jgi:hypothetical protein